MVKIIKIICQNINLCVINLAMKYVLSYNISSIDVLNRCGMIHSFIHSIFVEHLYAGHWHRH